MFVLVGVAQQTQLAAKRTDGERHHEELLPKSGAKSIKKERKKKN